MSATSDVITTKLAALPSLERLAALADEYGLASDALGALMSWFAKDSSDMTERTRTGFRLVRDLGRYVVANGLGEDPTGDLGTPELLASYVEPSPFAADVEPT